MAFAPLCHSDVSGGTRMGLITSSSQSSSPHSLPSSPLNCRDMIGGMRMDLVKSRYQSYDELYDYCYRVAGTVALMSCPVMGVDSGYNGPLEPVYRAALALGTANQLTNILR